MPMSVFGTLLYATEVGVGVLYYRVKTSPSDLLVFS